MATGTIEWTTTVVFVVCFIAAIAIETLWLIRKGWATPQKAVAFVMLSDTMSMCIGFLIPFVIIGAMLAASFGGGLETVPAATLWTALILALLFPPFFLFLTKRAFLAFFKLQSGAMAWKYSFLAAVLAMLLSFGPPALWFYLAGKIF
ncbi:MAG: hypothetical protein WBO10_15770 [Pyrinomonadaceae bacterium]